MLGMRFYLNPTDFNCRERHLEDSNIEICSYYESFDRGGREMMVPAGVYNLDDVKNYASSKG